MNNKQKYFLAAISIILTIAFLFPPFQIMVEEGRKGNAGFYFIFSTPGIGLPIVNVGLLLMEWLFILSIGFIGWLFFKDGK